jgi:hypothetical protein
MRGVMSGAMPVIGYYVHHQGRGHLHRALAIATCAPGRFTLLGTGLAGQTGAVAALDLPPDEPDAGTMFDAVPDSLHYAPLRHAGICRRMALLAAWIDQAAPAVMVCDVSVEIAMFARLMAVPTIYVRLNGDRSDAAHLDAFRGAQALLAPFHEALDDERTPDWVRRKTTYCPGITQAAPARAVAAATILVVGGAGGAPLDGPAIAAAARATPGYRWRVIGHRTAADDPDNVVFLGWVDDAAAEIAGAAVIVGAAGDGLVNAVIAGGKPFICLPQPRPYGEQAAKAARLAARGAAITLAAWPADAAWPGLIARALAMDTRHLAALHDPAGAQRAADFIMAVAARFA